MISSPAEPLTAHFMDALYTEAMLLADEAKSYFDDGARKDQLTLDPLTRVSFSCESLKVTTRLMHMIAWLLTRRAVRGGKTTLFDSQGLLRKLGHAADSDDGSVARLPEDARMLIAASCELYARIKRLDDNDGAASSPARALMARLERSI